MTFSESVNACLSKSFDAKGRASRSEFWWFYLFNTVTYIFTQVASTITTGTLSTVLAWSWLALFPAEISAGIRRMHDVDRSGWFYLIPIYNIVLLVEIGTAGPNRYGDRTDGVPDFVFPEG